LSNTNFHLKLFRDWEEKKYCAVLDLLVADILLMKATDHTKTILKAIVTTSKELAFFPKILPQFPF